MFSISQNLPSSYSSNSKQVWQSWILWTNSTSPFKTKSKGGKFHYKNIALRKATSIHISDTSSQPKTFRFVCGIWSAVSVILLFVYIILRFIRSSSSMSNVNLLKISRKSAHPRSEGTDAEHIMEISVKIKDFSTVLSCTDRNQRPSSYGRSGDATCCTQHVACMCLVTRLTSSWILWTDSDRAEHLTIL